MNCGMCLSKIGSERNELRNVRNELRNVFVWRAECFSLQLLRERLGYGESALQRALTHGGALLPSVEG